MQICPISNDVTASIDAQNAEERDDEEKKTKMGDYRAAHADKGEKELEVDPQFSPPWLIDAVQLPRHAHLLSTIAREEPDIFKEDDMTWIVETAFDVPTAEEFLELLQETARRRSGFIPQHLIGGPYDENVPTNTDSHEISDADIMEKLKCKLAAVDISAFPQNLFSSLRRNLCIERIRRNALTGVILRSDALEFDAPTSNCIGSNRNVLMQTRFRDAAMALLSDASGNRHDHSYEDAVIEALIHIPPKKLLRL